MFRRSFLFWCLLVCSALEAPLLRANEFTIELTAAAGKDGKTVVKYPVAKEGTARLILVSRPNQPVKIQWTVQRVGKSVAKDVLVHFFAVKIDGLNQKDSPKLNKNVAAESAFTMDFKAQDKAEGDLTFAAPKAGVYLLRLELKGTGGKAGYEPFVALDLSVR